MQLLFLLCFLLALTSQGFSGGLCLYELGTPDVGLASAGWAARAEDAGTVFTNPAGMTRFQRPEILFGVQPLYSHVKFDPNSQTTVPGKDGNASTGLPAGGSYFVLPISDRISFGAASLGYFGSAVDFGHHWVGRYYLTRLACQGFSFISGGAYRLSNSFSIGLCANVMYAIDRNHAQVNNALDGLPDGRVRAIGNHWAVGAVVGLLYEPTECLRFGVTYVSRVKQKFSMKPTFLDIGPRLHTILNDTGVLNSKVKIVCKVPNWVTCSAYYKLNPRFAIMGNVGWQEWSKFSRAEISLDSDNALTITVTPKYEDTWHVALGTQVFLDSCSTLSFGMAYDSSMVSNKNRTLSLPVGSQWRFGTGYQFALKECLQLTAAYELIWSGNLKVFQSRGPLAGTVSGKFRNTYLHVFNFSLTWDL